MAVLFDPLLTDPFREVERLTDRLFGRVRNGWSPAWMPMDAYRKGDEVYLHFDLPGIDADSIDLTVERNVLTVQAERARAIGEGDAVVISERPYGTFRRQVFLGTTSIQTSSRRTTRTAC